MNMNTVWMTIPIKLFVKESLYTEANNDEYIGNIQDVIYFLIRN